MKNPLTIIQMAAGLLDKADDLDERHQRLAHRIQHGTMQLRSLVTNVLDLARLEAGPTLQLMPLDPKEVVEKALAEVEPLATDKAQTLCCELPATLPLVHGGNVTLLTRAVVNLLSNAVKYTPEAKSITVRACGQEDTVQIQVIDTGAARGAAPSVRPFLSRAEQQCPSRRHGAGVEHRQKYYRQASRPYYGRKYAWAGQHFYDQVAPSP